METWRVVDFPHRSMDKRPRKRPRLTWDQMPTVLPAPQKVLPTIYCAQEFGVVPSYACLSIYYKGIPCNGSPPWRPDDKEGHYVFAIGKNLTPRCNYTRDILQFYHEGFASSTLLTFFGRRTDDTVAGADERPSQ